MNKPLEVDAFGIDLDILSNAYSYGATPFKAWQGRWKIVDILIRNLTPDSKKRFEEYQEQNDPCR